MKRKTCPLIRLSLSKECWAVLIVSMVGCTSIERRPAEAPTVGRGLIDNDDQAPLQFTPPSLDSDLQGESSHPMNHRMKADFYFTMGETHALEGNTRKAIEAYKTVLLYDPDSPTVHLRLAVESVKAGLLSESINYCEAAIRLDPKRVDSHLLLGGLYSSMKAYDGAIKTYEKALALDPGSHEAILYMGAVYAEKKEYKKALTYFKKLASDEEYSNRYIVEYYAGRIHQELKSFREAESAFKRSLDHKPDFFDSLVALGGLLEMQGKREQEIELYVKFQREFGPNSALATALAQTFLDRKDYEKALEQLKLLEEVGDDVLGVKTKIALIYVEQQKFLEAVAKLEETLHLVPESDKVRFYLAALLEEMKEFDQAIALFREIPVESSYYSESAIHAAFLLKQKGELGAASLVLERALEKKPENPQMFSLYAAIMDARGEPEKALAPLQQGINRFQNNPQILFYYGTINDKLGKKEVMIESMRKVIALDPKHTQAINYLAYTFAEESSNLAEAETLARKANTLAPEDPFIMDTLGWVLYKQGRIKEAIPWLETAYGQQPNESVIADHLGDAYIKNRMPEKARQMYQKAITLEQDRSRKRNIQEKLSALEAGTTDPRVPASVIAPKRPQPQSQSQPQSQPQSQLAEDSVAP